MDNNVVRQTANVLAVAATIVVNALANALPLNNQTTGEIADRFPIFFVPAGYVFAIWSLIYVGLVGFAVFQALPAQRDNPRLRAVGYLLVLASAFNISWLLLWHYEVFPLTLVVMIGLLLSLIAIYRRLEIGRASVSTGEVWLAHVPISIYLGWITVATIANASQVLYYLGWDGWGLSGQAWTAVVLAVAVAIAGLVAWRRRDVAYLLVLVWAFPGIAVKHPEAALVSAAAWAATAAVALLIVAAIVAKRQAVPAAP